MWTATTSTGAADTTGGDPLSVPQLWRTARVPLPGLARPLPELSALLAPAEAFAGTPIYYRTVD